MDVAALLVDAFTRVDQAVRRAVDGLTPDQLAFRPDGGANSIAWLIWHLARVQDDHLADVMGTEQVWTSRGWVQRFALPLEPSDTGYGHTADEVGAVRVESAGLLIGYCTAVHQETVRYVGGLGDDDLDRIVDYAWDPPVSLGVRLVSVITDDLEHAGQAAYLRGLLDRQ